MLESGKIVVRNFQRKRKVDTQKKKQSYCSTPPKYLQKQSTYNRYYRAEKKYGYEYEMGDSKVLNQLKNQFENNFIKYHNHKEFTKKLGRKDKYQMNQKLGTKTFKKNPILKIFNRIQNKIQRADKLVVLELLKRI